MTGFGEGRTRADPKLPADPSARWLTHRIKPRDPTWKRPRRARVRAIRDRLRGLYGPKQNQPHGDPVHEIVLTILSQNTNDRNRDVAYERLRESFSSWEEVRDAPLDRLVEAIRPGGLGPSKGPRIQEVLRTLGDEIELDWLADAPREKAIGYLTALPGIGRKTAACVMIFSFDRPEVPVDTHVHRVGVRLGFFRPEASLEEAHDEMLAITDPGDAYELHMNLIEHGRQICRSRPRCGECPLQRLCPYYRERRDLEAPDRRLVSRRSPDHQGRAP